jgi:2-dehydrotetronate isomerase
MLRFAANLSFLYGEHAFPERFAAAAKDEFQGVEYLFPYDYPAREIAGWLRTHGLTQVLFNAPPGDWAAGERGLAALPGREEEFRTGIHKALEYAQVLECPRVHVMAGLRPGERSTYVKNLAWAAELAAAQAVQLLIEPINTRDMPGYFLNRQDEAQGVVAEVGSSALQVQMDLYHCQIVEGDVCMKLRKYLPEGHVGHLQVASVPDRNEPDQGELNYGYVFGELEKIGWDGWIGCEYRPRGGTSAGLGWLKRLV